MLRKTLLILAIFLALILLALLLLPAFVDSKKLLDPVLAQIEDSSGISLKIGGDARLRLIPRPGISLRDISLQMPDDQEPGLHADGFDLGLRLFPLLSLRVEVERFALDNLTFAAAASGADTPPGVDVSGKFSFDERARLLNLSAVRAILNGITDDPVVLVLSGPVDIESRNAELTLDLEHGEVRGGGTLNYAADASPEVDAKLHLNRFSPALYALAGPDAAAEVDTSSSAAGAEVLPLDALRAMDTRAELTIDEVLWQGYAIHNLQARLRVVNGNAILPGITGDVYGGKLAMKANLNAQPAVPRINTEGSLTGVDIASLLAASQVETVLTGSANLDWDLRGQGNTADAIRDSLRGPIHLTTDNAELTAVGVEQKLCEVVALANREAMSNALPDSSQFQQLSATVQLENGRALLQPLKADLPEMSLSGKGKLDLASQDFDAVFNARLSPALEQLDPACRVNERITSIKWPVECEGNLAGEPKEWCSVDSKEILKDLGGNELKNKLQDELEDRYGKDAGDKLKKLFGK
ncbi:AsmA family protein [Haliea sp. E17]|uniref:AsmA family protein n=1 Tax=Haliea sp. E17 TaxID=3401576 RepID=UPI003AAE8325